MNYVTQIQSKYKCKKPSKDNISLNCPFCTDSGYSQDTGHNLWVGTKIPAYHCWRCDIHGHVYKLLKLLSISFDDDFLFEDTDYNLEISIYDELKRLDNNVTIDLPQEYIALHKDIQSLTGKQALTYLIKRKINYDKIDKYKLGFCSTGYYGQRIIIPVYDESNNLLFYVARSYFDNVEKKILNPSKEKTGVGKSEIIYNINNNVYKDTVIVNEGPFDAMSTDGIALFGKMPSDEQIRKIKKLK